MQASGQARELCSWEGRVVCKGSPGADADVRFGVCMFGAHSQKKEKKSED